MVFSKRFHVNLGLVAEEMLITYTEHVVLL